MNKMPPSNSMPDPLAAQVHAMMHQAFAYHQRGRLSQAQQLYEEILKLQPDFFDALHLLGVIALQAGNPGRAVELIGKAIAIHPHNPAFHFNLGMALQSLNQLEAAVASFDRALAIHPDYAEARFNRAQALHRLGFLDQAISDYDRVIALHPHGIDAYFHRGNALHANGQLQKAIDSYDRAIAIMPDFAEAYCNRGVALKGLNRLQEALASYEQAIALKPDYADAHANRGNVLQALTQLDAALASYDNAIAMQADCVEAHANRGAVLHQMMQLDEALASYDKAISLKPDHAQAQANKALLKLLTGKYAVGWRLYEWRWQSVQKQFVRNFTAPLWLGKEPLQDKTILLHCEQGLGDTLQFCRYVKLVAEQGANVIVEAPDSLVQLLKTLDGVSSVVTSIDKSGLAYDYQCPLMSLPLAFKTTLQTIPSACPYLKVDTSKAAYWRERLQTLSGLRAGVVWFGSFMPGHAQRAELNERRNMPVTHLAALNMPGIDFISLQIGEEARQQLKQLQASQWSGPCILDFTDELHDFSDTAALIANLDLVISVDTSVAHLAGALDKPVWLLNRFDTCWRWLIGREDSPWYPSMRIFRQHRAGDWEGVIAEVRNELGKLQANAG